MKHVVVIGASAGGIEALRTIVSGLPENFPAPICIVMHVAPQAPGVLPQIIGRATTLPTTSARTGERLQAGHIYVAPPDYHLVVEPGKLRVTKGPRENRFRPAIDPLFRSAAQVYGPRAIGVVLTGQLDDGTAGLWTIKQLGGTAVVQDPADAMFPDMPANAMEHVKVDHVVPLAEIPPLLVRLTVAPVEAEPVAVPEHVPEHVEVEVRIAKEQNPLQAGLEDISEPSSYSCPECHGVLLQLMEGGRVRFRCHTGHAYSSASLLSAVEEGIEDSLWNALRALEEGGMLMRRMAEHLTTSHSGIGADGLRERGDEAHRQSELIRKLLAERDRPVDAVKP
jgi:two-component system, chemotaxis family, protein-glutamate methylesterase/glutaminase